MHVDPGEKGSEAKVCQRTEAIAETRARLYMVRDAFRLTVKSPNKIQHQSPSTSCTPVCRRILAIDDQSAPAIAPAIKATGHDKGGKRRKFRGDHEARSRPTRSAFAPELMTLACESAHRQTRRRKIIWCDLVPARGDESMDPNAPRTSAPIRINGFFPAIKIRKALTMRAEPTAAAASQVPLPKGDIEERG